MDNVTLAFLLIFGGIALMLVELALPTGGILFVCAGGAIVIGAALAVFYADPYVGIATLIGVIVLVPALWGALFYYFPGAAMGDRLAVPEESTVAHMPGVQGLDQYKGRVGKAASALRPAGTVDFEGHRIDCVSEGMMIEAGRWVRCIEVKSGRVVVRQIDAPAAPAFENADFD